MKKEVVLAIVIGFGLGLIITYGIWLANKSLKTISPTDATPTPEISESTLPTTQPEITQSPSPKLTPTQSNGVNLNITSPQDELLSESAKITVKGTTNPSAIVAIAYEGGQQLVSADASGNFSAEVALDGGYNLITVTATDKQGNSTSQTLTVTYTTAKL